jgi:hypothetical protein
VKEAILKIQTAIGDLCDWRSKGREVAKERRNLGGFVVYREIMALS